MSTHKEILLFLQGKSEKGLEIITNIFYKELNSNSFSGLKNISEDLFMELMEKIFSKREFIIEKFKDEEKGLSSYIREMIKNLFKDKLLNMSKNPLDKVNINEGDFAKTYNNNPEKIMESIEASKVKEVFEGKLSEEEFLVLCYIISNKEEKRKYEEKFFKDISKDALYKRVQRFKEKLAKIVKNYNFAEGSVMFYLENLLPKTCKKVENERN
ncbi:MAG: hypothetical protein DSY47_04390 [Hydrogenothermus sp.]|nr:MAG: hypothetical protein DSY47_04390 [Hydrogenothermus sp.]